MSRLRLSTFVVLATLALQCSTAPAPQPDPDRPEIIEIIAPAQAAQETLDSLNLGEPNSEQSERSKRTIGILRQLFPTLSEIIDQKVQQIASLLFRTVGRSILTGVLGGGGGGGGGASTTNNGGRVSVSLPAYSPDDDDDDDDTSDEDKDDKKDSEPQAANVANRFGQDTQSTTQSDDEVQTSNIEASSESSSLINHDGQPDTTTEPVSLTAETSTTTLSPPSSDGPLVTDSTSTSSSSSSTTTESSTPVVSTTPATANGNTDENALSEAESQQSEVRVQFTDSDSEKKSEDLKDDQGVDQESAASGGNNGAIDDLSLDDADSSDENRNKRFLNFGLGGSGSGGTSGGGSGNFLFDIIRQPAEGAARAAGHFFRMLTGTDSIGLGITATHTAVRDLPAAKNNASSRLLVAGSGGTEQSDEAAAAPADDGVGKGDGYTEGIPGPVTRLFIIANRGIANLIQDLILRIAQTSERLVNFKARLITSII